MVTCDICKKEIKEVGIDLVGAVCLKFKDESGEYYVTRCDGCFSNDKTLKNYRKTEVYSRVVGYIRPVQQWHKGKRQEYAERLVFKPV
jgi:hypothetical protein